MLLPRQLKMLGISTWSPAQTLGDRIRNKYLCSDYSFRPLALAWRLDNHAAHLIAPRPMTINLKLLLVSRGDGNWFIPSSPFPLPVTQAVPTRLQNIPFSRIHTGFKLLHRNQLTSSQGRKRDTGRRSQSAAATEKGMAGELNQVWRAIHVQVIPTPKSVSKPNLPPNLPYTNRLTASWIITAKTGEARQKLKKYRLLSGVGKIPAVKERAARINSYDVSRILGGNRAIEQISEKRRQTPGNFSLRPVSSGLATNLKVNSTHMYPRIMLSGLSWPRDLGPVRPEHAITGPGQGMVLNVLTAIKKPIRHEENHHFFNEHLYRQNQILRTEKIFIEQAEQRALSVPVRSLPAEKIVMSGVKQRPSLLLPMALTAEKIEKNQPGQLYSSLLIRSLILAGTPLKQIMQFEHLYVPAFSLPARVKIQNATGNIQLLPQRNRDGSHLAAQRPILVMPPDYMDAGKTGFTIRDPRTENPRAKRLPWGIRHQVIAPKNRRMSGKLMPLRREIELSKHRGLDNGKDHPGSSLSGMGLPAEPILIPVSSINNSRKYLSDILKSALIADPIKGIRSFVPSAGPVSLIGQAAAGSLNKPLTRRPGEGEFNSDPGFAEMKSLIPLNWRRGITGFNRGSITERRATDFIPQLVKTAWWRLILNIKGNGAPKSKWQPEIYHLYSTPLIDSNDIMINRKPLKKMNELTAQLAAAKNQILSMTTGANRGKSELDKVGNERHPINRLPVPVLHYSGYADFMKPGRKANFSRPGYHNYGYRRAGVTPAAKYGLSLMTVNSRGQRFFGGAVKQSDEPITGAIPGKVLPFPTKNTLRKQRGWHKKEDRPEIKSSGSGPPTKLILRPVSLLNDRSQDFPDIFKVTLRADPGKGIPSFFISARPVTLTRQAVAGSLNNLPGRRGREAEINSGRGIADLESLMLNQRRTITGFNKEANTGRKTQYSLPQLIKPGWWPQIFNLKGNKGDLKIKGQIPEIYHLYPKPLIGSGDIMVNHEPWKKASKLTAHRGLSRNQRRQVLDIPVRILLFIIQEHNRKGKRINLLPTRMGNKAKPDNFALKLTQAKAAGRYSENDSALSPLQLAPGFAGSSNNFVSGRDSSGKLAPLPSAGWVSRYARQSRVTGIEAKAKDFSFREGLQARMDRHNRGINKAKIPSPKAGIAVSYGQLSLIQYQGLDSGHGKQLQSYAALASGPDLAYRRDTSPAAAGYPEGFSDTPTRSIDTEVKVQVAGAGNSELKGNEIKKIADRVYREIQQRMKVERQRRGL